MTAAAQQAPVQAINSHGIGGSEIGTAIGLNKYRQPLSLWMEKTGRAPSFEGNEATKWGHRHEPNIRIEYMERHQVAMYVPSESLYHPTLTWMRATPDGIVLDVSSDPPVWRYCVQMKAPGGRQMWRWPESGVIADVPIEYLCQVAWECAVTDLPRCDLAVLLTNNDYREYTYERDLDFERDLIEAGQAFWDCVEADTPPAVDASKEWKRYLEEQAARAVRRGVVVPRSDATDEIADALRKAVRKHRKAEERMDGLKNDLRKVLVEAGADALDSALGTFTWRQNKSGTKTDWMAVALELAANRDADFDALVKRHTTTTPGARPFLVPRSFHKPEGDA